MSQQPGLDKRKLHSVLDRKGFNKLFDELRPELEKYIKNHLPGADGDLKMKLKFRSIEDFRVERIIEQMPALKAFFEQRTALALLKNAVGANDKTKQLLVKVQLSAEVKGALAGS